MNRTAVAQRLFGLVDSLGGTPPDETVAFAAEMIERLNPNSHCYEANVDMLLSLEATLWARERGVKG